MTEAEVEATLIKLCERMAVDTVCKLEPPFTDDEIVSLAKAFRDNNRNAIHSAGLEVTEAALAHAKQVYAERLWWFSDFAWNVYGDLREELLGKWGNPL